MGARTSFHLILGGIFQTDHIVSSFGNVLLKSDHIGKILRKLILVSHFGKRIILTSHIGANMSQNPPIWVIFVTSVESVGYNSS
jgi:hypothetical protein